MIGELRLDRRARRLRVYRHGPNTVPVSRGRPRRHQPGVRLALMAMQGEMSYPSALSAKHWGYLRRVFTVNLLCSVARWAAT